MVSIVNHGGACCGMRHIYGFGGYDWALREQETFASTLKAVPPSRMAEVTLTDRQCIPKRLKMLKDAGFSPTLSFVNGNTGNKVFVFHRYNTVKNVPGKRLRLDAVPTNWPGEEPLVAEAPSTEAAYVLVTT